MEVGHRTSSRLKSQHIGPKIFHSQGVVQKLSETSHHHKQEDDTLGLLLEDDTKVG